VIASTALELIEKYFDGAQKNRLPLQPPAVAALSGLESPTIRDTIRESNFVNPNYCGLRMGSKGEGMKVATIRVIFVAALLIGVCVSVLAQEIRRFDADAPYRGRDVVAGR
jgi:hypothetical protein